MHSFKLPLGEMESLRGERGTVVLLLGERRKRRGRCGVRGTAGQERGGVGEAVQLGHSQAGKYSETVWKWKGKRGEESCSSSAGILQKASFEGDTNL